MVISIPNSFDCSGEKIRVIFCEVRGMTISVHYRLVCESVSALMEKIIPAYVSYFGEYIVAI
jgi:hypothetical protein